MNREPSPPSDFNRVSSLLAGCADAGGVHPIPGTPPHQTDAFRPQPTPKVTNLVVPPTLSVSELAGALGLKFFVVIRGLVELDIYASPVTPLDFATITRLCAQFGVSVQPDS